MAEATAVLVEQLRRALQHGAARPVTVVETHLSWVLLADTLAYKIKKPLVLPFADFGTLALRRHFCDEEVRLNRRLAPTLYLGVSPITGSADEPVLDGSGRAVEYAVRMRRFPDGALLSERALRGALQPDDIDRLAARLAAFHAAAPRAAAGSSFGSAERRERAARAAFDAVVASAPRGRDGLDTLGRWLRAEAGALAPLWRRRQAEGLVREVHGDLHLANLLLLDGEPTAFDGIEFDPALRWIDIVDDAAFVAMDLMAHGLDALAWRFVNAWLDATGDHDGLPLWRYAMVYRALVRAQVALIRAQQGGAAPRPGAQACIDLAQRLARGGGAAPNDARLLIAHGLPGSGKSFVSQALAQRCGAIRLRSDVERKRLFGLGALDDSRARAPGVAVYGSDATRRTYERLAALARTALQAGWPTIVDAAFLRRDERARFAALARGLGLPFSILDCRAPHATLHERVAARRAAGDDPSEADAGVLDALAAAEEPLLDDERAAALVADATNGPDPTALAAAWRAAPVRASAAHPAPA